MSGLPIIVDRRLDSSRRREKGLPGTSAVTSRTKSATRVCLFVIFLSLVGALHTARPLLRGVVAVGDTPHGSDQWSLARDSVQATAARAISGSTVASQLYENTMKTVFSRNTVFILFLFFILAYLLLLYIGHEWPNPSIAELKSLCYSFLFFLNDFDYIFFLLCCSFYTYTLTNIVRIIIVCKGRNIFNNNSSNKKLS